MQILQRPGSDQNIQPPLLIDDQHPQGTGPFITKDINNIDSSSVQMVIVPSLQSFEQEPGDAQLSKYLAFSEFLIA